MSKDRRQQALGWVSVVEEVVRRIHRHRVGAEAASIAFYFFLSFFPLILLLFSFTGLVGREAAFDWIMDELLVALPEESSVYIAEFVRQVTSSWSYSTLSISVLLSLWTSSNIFAVLAEGLNRAYQAKSRHRWWKRRVLALALLLVLAGALIVLAVAVLAGPEIARALQFETLGGRLAWPLTFGLAIAMMWLIYYWLPNHDQSRSKRWILAGALVGTSMWGGATVLFRLFLSSSGRFTAIYGFIGGIAALLIWLYLTAMSILVGGEVAAVMESRAMTRRRLRRVAERLPTKAPASTSGA